MKCICNSKSKDLIISIKDDNVVFQTCNYYFSWLGNNTKNVIHKFQGLYDFSDSNDNQIIRLMSQISCKNIDKNSFKQILEINTNCSCIFGSQVSIPKCLLIMTPISGLLVLRIQLLQQSNNKRNKEKRKVKPKDKQSQPKSEVEKSKQISDSKNSSKSTKYCLFVNEDIRLFEEKIKQYTSEIDDSQKIVLNLPKEWIKKFGIQKKKKMINTIPASQILMIIFLIFMLQYKGQEIHISICFYCAQIGILFISEHFIVNSK